MKFSGAKKGKTDGQASNRIEFFSLPNYGFDWTNETRTIFKLSYRLKNESSYQTDLVEMKKGPLKSAAHKNPAAKPATWNSLAFFICYQETKIILSNHFPISFLWVFFFCCFIFLYFFAHIISMFSIENVNFGCKYNGFSSFPTWRKAIFSKTEGCLQTWPTRFFRDPWIIRYRWWWLLPVPLKIVWLRILWVWVFSSTHAPHQISKHLTH